MTILQPRAVLSYCPFPALPAPKIAGLLPPPRIAGLLPAQASRTRQAAPPPLRAARVEFLEPASRSLDEFLATLGPIRTREEMNAELLAILHAPREYRP